MYIHLFVILAVAWITCFSIGIVLKAYSNGAFVDIERAAVENANNILIVGLTLIGAIFITLRINNKIVYYIIFCAALIFVLRDLVQTIKSLFLAIGRYYSIVRTPFVSKEFEMKKNNAFGILFFSDLAEQLFFAYTTFIMFKVFF